MKFKQLVKKILLSPLGYPVRSYYVGKATCVVYHRITDQIYLPEDFNPESGLAVHSSKFDEQLAYYAAHKEVLDLSNFEKHLLDYSLHKDSLLITFDDGYKDNLTLALPLLEKYQLPACIFVSTGFVTGEFFPWWHALGKILMEQETIDFTFRGKSYYFEIATPEQKLAAYIELDQVFKSLDPKGVQQLVQIVFRDLDLRAFQELYLSWDDIKFLDQHPLITIAAHTHSHPALRQLDDQQLSWELEHSKKLLEEALDHEVPYFAYPYGKRSECSARSFAAVAKAGYRMAFTTRTGHIHSNHAQHLLTLPRVVVDHFHTMEDLEELILSGLSAMINRKGERLVTD